MHHSSKHGVKPFLLLGASLVVFATGAHGQLNVTRSETPNGAGTQASADYRITATIGQPGLGSTQQGSTVIQTGFGYYDQFSPTAVCQNITIKLTAGTAVLTESQVDAGSADNVGIALRSLSKTIFTEADLGENTITYTVTDYVGLSDSCTLIVTVLPENIAASVWMFLGE